jgi:hypothetical protein
MADRGLRDQIASIESDIEQLAQALEGCRKAMAVSKMAIAAGGIWILVYLLGAIRFEPATMIGAIAAIIGGVVVLGSNSSTAKETMTAMKAAETQRAELIDTIDLRPVGARPGDLQGLER